MPIIPINGGVLIIDESDVPLLKNYRKPHVNENGYVIIAKRGKGHTKQERLHRILMEAKKGEEVDHINHIRHDNRRENLRVCTVSENRRNSLMRSHNTSGYRGVSFWSNKTRRKKRWESYIRLDGKKKRIGYFLTAVEAAKAYDVAAIKHYGEFAIINGV